MTAPVVNAGMVSVVVALSLLAASAGGQPAASGDPQAVAEATALFTKGSELFLKKRYAEALAALQRSHALVPSPNSALFVARCLREQGRSAEAATGFDEVQQEAAAKAAAGDRHYDETAKAAASEGADLRAKVGQVNIRVPHLPAGGQVLIDGVPAPASPTGDGYRAYRDPGTVTVTLRAPPGPDVVKSLLVKAGDHADVDLEPGVVLPPPPARPGWMVPVLAAAGGVGVLGIAMSVGFGVSSRSTFDSLQSTCGTRCTSPGEQDQIASGMRNQTASNVSLAFGLAGAGVAAAVAVLVWRGRPREAPVSIDLGPGHVTIAGRF